MRTFEYEHHALFFGRERQAYALYRLTHFGFIAVIGASGSGKSSLVRAGLLPILDSAARERPWRVATATPGSAPFERLADAIASFDEDENADARAIRRERIGYLLRRSNSGIADALAEMPHLAGSSILVVIDQFEEIFRDTAPQRREEHAAYVQALLHLYRFRPSARVLVTMRSDFIGDCAQFAGLPEAVSETQFLVPSLSREQRRATIEKPLSLMGATIEPLLVERLLNDAGFDNDQLPILQHALMRMWIASVRRDPSKVALTLADYLSIGKLAGAISDHANEIAAEFSGREHVVEAVFRALSERDIEGRAVRRVLTLRAIVAETGMPESDVRAVVDRFRARDCGFLLPRTGPLTPDLPIDVVHEALLRGWDRMTSSSERRGWLENEEDDGRYYRSLLARIDGGETTLPIDRVAERYAWWTSAPHTAAWTERYGGRRERVERFFTQSFEALAAFERSAAEAEAVETERRIAKERTTRRFLVLSAGISAVVIVLLVVTILALLRAERTTNTSLVKQSDFLARDAEAESDRGDAVDAALLALQALPANTSRPDRPFTWPAYGALTDALANVRELHTYRIGGKYLEVRYLPGTRRFWVSQLNGTVELWTLGGTRPDRTFKTGSRPSDVEFSDKARFLAVGTFGGDVHVWNVSSNTLSFVLHGNAEIVSATFRDRARLLVVSRTDYTTTVYDARNGRKIRSIAGIIENAEQIPKAYDIRALLVDRDGSIAIWDRLLEHRVGRYAPDTSQISDSAMSRDGKVAAAAHVDGTFDLWDNDTGQRRFRISDTGGAIADIYLSDDKKTLVTGHREFIHVWNAVTGKLVATIPQRAADSTFFTLSLDGKRLVTFNADGSINIWSTMRGVRLAALAGHEGRRVGRALQ